MSYQSHKPGLCLVIGALAASLAACRPSHESHRRKITTPEDQAPGESANDPRTVGIASLPSGLAGKDGAGATIVAQGESVVFKAYSKHATRLEVALFTQAMGATESLRKPMKKEPGSDYWVARVTRAELTKAGFGETFDADGQVKNPIYYGYRAFGPNWPYDPAWKPGSATGFVADVDAQGNRFNPNKLLLDPYAREVSHDPVNARHRSRVDYATGPEHRNADTASFAPKGLVLPLPAPWGGKRPERPFKDEVIYEVHVRGFTKNDKDLKVPPDCLGTYLAAAAKAPYLRDIGVTAVEFLPVQETENDQNDLEEGTAGDNYWGYMTSNYFAPDRRYACDKGPGGPTREFRAMAEAFHAQGIKVYIDVVYNHTAEGGVWDDKGQVTGLFSWRGLDNQTYYELAGDRRYFYDNTGIGANLNTANDVVREMIVDSLRHWKDGLGVDGFRFDLAPVLGNTCEKDCYAFDKMEGRNALNRIVRELPVRPDEGGAGIDLMAEPWAIGDYRVGGFPSGWGEWNGMFRDTMRKAQNKLGFEPVTPGQLALRLSGSADLFQDDGRKPWHSVNFMVAHDGFTLRDLYAFNDKVNDQAWPFGPSDGGEDHNIGWDQGGDAARQRQAARTGLALTMLSVGGVPMITGGDEMYRTQRGNNNAYNLDSVGNWLDWANVKTFAPFHAFARGLMRFRAAHPAMRPADWWRGIDGNNNGLKDITWLRADGQEVDRGYWDDPGQTFVAYRVDGTEKGDKATSIYMAYNRGADAVAVTLSANVPGKAWYRVADTAAWYEKDGNIATPGREPVMTGVYTLSGRSILLLIEK